MSGERDIDQVVLLDYLDGNLEAAEHEAVRAALAESVELQRELAELEALRYELGSLSVGAEVTIGIDLKDSVLASIRGRASDDLPADFLDRDAFLDEVLTHLEGGSDEAPQRALDSPVHHDEYLLIRGLLADLAAIGEAHSRRLPTIDVVDSVMATVRQASRPANVTPLEERRRGRWQYWAGGLGAVAAAAIALIAWFAGSNEPAAPGLDVDAPVIAGPEPGQPLPEQADTESDDAKALLQKILQDIDSLERTKTASLAIEEDEPSTPLGALEARGVFQLRAQAATDPLKREQLNRLATLSPRLAGEVIMAAEASAQAKVAAATMLSTGEAAEAIASLRDTGVLGDDVYSHFQVALAFLAERGLGENEPVENPTLTLEDALESITALQEQDPENALAWYMEAAARFYAGDSQGAMVALEEAGTRQEASAYSGEAAQANQEALAEAGMNEDAATSVAAFTSGTDEYRALLDLGLELLEIGREYVETDPEAAETVFSSVDDMGQQLQTSPDYSYEYLAGLDLQLEAMSVFEEFWNVLGLTGDTMTSMTTEAESLSGAYTDFQAVVSAINAVFFEEMTTELMNSILGVILGEGDLYLPVHFPAN